MPKISAVGLFSCDKFEETKKQKVIDQSKLNKFYFNNVPTKVEKILEIWDLHKIIENPKTNALSKKRIARDR